MPAYPKSFGVGAKVRPLSAALISLGEPWNVSTESLDPVPTVKVRPVVEPRVSSPLTAVRVTCSVVFAMLFMVIAFELAGEKVSVAFSFVCCADGTDTVGG